MEFSASLNKVASNLIEKGRQDLADEVTKIASELDKQAAMQECLDNLDTSDATIKEASEIIAEEYAELKMASDEYAAAHADIVEATKTIEAAQRTIEAAKAKKKKWVQKIDLKKGRLTKYKKPGESMEDAARRALKSEDPSVRGMGGFFLSTKTFKKKGKK